MAGISLNLPSQGALGLEKRELMGIKSAFPPPPALAELTGPAGRPFWDAFPTLGVDSGVTSEGPGRVRVGYAESATKTPPKAIPAGDLSMKSGGEVKEAKLPPDSWPREIFLAKKNQDCPAWREH